MGAIASEITSLTIVYSTVYSDADQRKHQSSASLTFVRGIHRWPVNSPHKWPVTRKMFPSDDVIMVKLTVWWCNSDCRNKPKSATRKSHLSCLSSVICKYEYPLEENHCPWHPRPCLIKCQPFVGKYWIACELPNLPNFRRNDLIVSMIEVVGIKSWPHSRNFCVHVSVAAGEWWWKFTALIQISSILLCLC